MFITAEKEKKCTCIESYNKKESWIFGVGHLEYLITHVFYGEEVFKDRRTTFKNLFFLLRLGSE